MLLRRTARMSASDAFAGMRRGDLQLVDVRAPGELEQARVDGALHIPLGTLAARLGELDRGRPVAFPCRSGNRSARATRMAAAAGFDAANVQGGVIAWARADLPLTSDGRGRGRRSSAS